MIAGILAALTLALLAGAHVYYRIEAYKDEMEDET